MQPTVIKIGQRARLNAAGQFEQVYVITFNVGTNGPFEQLATKAEIDNGTALREMQNFATSLAKFPGVSA